MATSLQDILKRRQQEEFFGREEQLAFFHRNLGLAPDNSSHRSTCCAPRVRYDLARLECPRRCQVLFPCSSQRLPPAKISAVAEHVWLLEKTSAHTLFLVFGSRHEFPDLWLESYGRLTVSSYLLTEDSGLMTLTKESDK